jgi:hypothetical protein
MVESRRSAQRGFSEMRIAMTLEGHHDLDILEAQLRFHRAVGVDVVLMRDPGKDRAAWQVVEPFAADGFVQLVEEVEPSALRARFLAGSTSEDAPEWMMDCRAGEFWWPRGASLADVLSPIPPRYTVVQALARRFVAQSGDAPFAERMTVRASLLSPGAVADPLDSALRPVLRNTGRPSERTSDIPLRAWYPIEVLCFPSSSVGPTAAAPVLVDDEIERGLADGALIADERLQEALRRLSPPGAPRVSLELPIPDVVDDAEYAIECAALGEVDLEALDRHIRALEARIAWLEQRFWPRVLRRVSRAVRR